MVWVYLNELAHNDMLEFGHVLAKPGDEQSWFEDLPSDLRDHMVALDHSAGAIPKSRPLTVVMAST